MSDELKECRFWADSRDRLRSFPESVRQDIGHALDLIQRGGTPPHFDFLPELGSGVMEVKSSHDKEAYRAFYVAKFPEAVYVLGAIHKKSKKGKGLPKKDKNRIRRRYKELTAYRERQGLAK